METFVTYFGKIICFDILQRRVIQIDAKKITNQTLVFDASDISAGRLRFRNLIGDQAQVSAPDFVDSRSFPSSNIRIVPAYPDSIGLSQVFALRAGNKYLRSTPYNGVDFDADAVHPWETYRKISFNVLSDIRWMLSNDWITGAGKKRIRSEQVQMINHNSIDFGSYSIDIDQLPLQNSLRVDCGDGWSAPISGVLFRDEWKHDIVYTFKPLISYCIFGKNDRLLEQLKDSTHSLIEFAKYDGMVLIISNIPGSELLEYLPPELADKTIFRFMQAHDQLDVMASRLSLAEDESLQSYQPVMYVDTDVVFDAPIEPILIDLTVSSGISAQVEENNILGVTESIGGTLFKDDPMDCDGRSGFCAGVIGIPGLARSSWALKASARSLVAYVSQHGRSSIPHFEQSMLNYSLHRLGYFQVEPISPATRAVGWDTNYDLPSRKGFVHFWQEKNKNEAMKKYIRNIRGEGPNTAP